MMDDHRCPVCHRPASQHTPDEWQRHQRKQAEVLTARERVVAALQRGMQA